jgi:hypothetical protein
MQTISGLFCEEGSESLVTALFVDPLPPDVHINGIYYDGLLGTIGMCESWIKFKGPDKDGYYFCGHLERFEAWCEKMPGEEYTKWNLGAPLVSTRKPYVGQIVRFYSMSRGTFMPAIVESFVSSDKPNATPCVTVYIFRQGHTAFVPLLDPLLDTRQGKQLIWLRRLDNYHIQPDGMLFDGRPDDPNVVDPREIVPTLSWCEWIPEVENRGVPLAEPSLSDTKPDEVKPDEVKPDEVKPSPKRRKRKGA